MVRLIGIPHCIGRAGRSVALLVAIAPVITLAQDYDSQRNCNSFACQVVRSEASSGRTAVALHVAAPLTPLVAVALRYVSAPAAPIASLTPASRPAAPLPQDKEQPTEARKASEISLDASAGVTLQQILSDLGADAEWGTDSLGRVVIYGSYRGTKEAIAQAVLGDFNYAIMYDHARLRVIVINRNPKIGATNDGARISPPVSKRTGQASRPAQSRAEKIAAEENRRAGRAFGFGD
jgi:hypothetical protein